LHLQGTVLFYHHSDHAQLLVLLQLVQVQLQQQQQDCPF
jgi:hypothetical protein